MVVHKVYFLHHAVTGDLLYVGRTVNVQRRVRAFTKRTGIVPAVGPCMRFTDFKRACETELRCIRECRPPFNKQLVSSPGTLGLSTNLGVPKSEVTRARMRKPKTEQHRQSMRKPKSPEHKAKLRAVLIQARACRGE